MTVEEALGTWEHETYGTHLMLRLGRVQRVEALDSTRVIERYLRDLVLGIGMRILDGPYAKTEHASPDRYGHSGVVLLVESHAAIHTYPMLRTLFLDLFSCKAFDVSAVMAITHRQFGDFDVVESTVLNRGHHWTRDANEALKAWHLVS